jgi:hypothetical protein
MQKNKEQIAESINELLPDSSHFLGTDGENERQSIVEEKAKDIYDKKTAGALARVQYNMRINKESQIAKKAVSEYKEKVRKSTDDALQKLEEENQYISAEEAIEIGNNVAISHNAPTISMASDIAKNILATQGTTKPEVVKLLTGLNINLNLQLTKNDTANLLACLLTANENQLNAIYKNKKVPIAVKTVIKRLIDDAKLGNIDTVERLWDRVFGKTGMLLDLPEQTQQATGIIPNVPVSREAYIVIRDTLLK